VRKNIRKRHRPEVANGNFGPVLFAGLARPVKGEPEPAAA
jgi:hypothetical protein